MSTEDFSTPPKGAKTGAVWREWTHVAVSGRHSRAMEKNTARPWRAQLNVAELAFKAKSGPKSSDRSGPSHLLFLFFLCAFARSPYGACLAGESPAAGIGHVPA